ncbi:hypothetical protein [Roseomonas sp. BN140053]|uniref:hypothetical protein n=1 Tax=Roseomonas sp. BN140053 TaxID=3391898 RepID=UPI0039E90C40
MTIRTKFPADTAARLNIIPTGLVGGFPYVVILARPPVEPVTASLVRPGEVSTILTHDADVSWPDDHGHELAAATLGRNGVALLAFATLADAMACHAEVRRIQA